MSYPGNHTFELRRDVNHQIEPVSSQCNLTKNEVLDTGANMPTEEKARVDEVIHEPRTLADLHRVDIYEMDQIQKVLDMLIGHDYKREVLIRYRGHEFGLSLR